MSYKETWMIVLSNFIPILLLPIMLAMLEINLLTILVEDRTRHPFTNVSYPSPNNPTPSLSQD
jgi:hypothetical protein